jgi:hypothetical protein
MPTDTELVDFLADPAQSIANVTLPSHIVERNVHSLRDAIADAMKEHAAMAEQAEPTK